MIDPGLTKKVVLVTGANNPHGIGAEIAKAFAAQGCKVFLHYFRQATGGGESGRRRTRFRSEAEHHSVVNPNSIPV
jgi:NAD(P)-dependent dehydrogenase (short-subunit alcohol dehydrogenase family)